MKFTLKASDLRHHCFEPFEPFTEQQSQGKVTQVTPAEPSGRRAKRWCSAKKAKYNWKCKKHQKGSKSIKRVMRCHELSQLASPAECGLLRFAVDVGGMTRESRIQLFGALSRSTITVLLRIRWACHCFNPAQAAALYS